MDESEERLKVLKKRGFIVKEIISTEVTYVDRLRFAVEVVILPLRENNLLETNDLSTQFGIMEKICSLHSTQSIAELESHPDRLGQFFSHICDNVQIYTDYLVNYESAMQRRCSLLISNRRFSDFLDKAEKDPRLQNQKIESIFILPVQRIPRYRLLLEQLLKYTPEDHVQYGDVKSALDKICDMALYSNEAIRARENRAKIMDIIKSIEPRTRVDLLANTERSFLKEGPLLRQCRRGLKEFHFWLFNDELLYGQATPLGLYILNRQIPLNKCYVNACESMHEEGFSFIIESPAKSFIICFATEAEKTEWYEAIHNAIIALSQAQQIKQNRQFAPLWMPDKFSASCQKCRNAFSLINRRHHCRNCGAIVCDNCSKKRIKLEHVDQHRQVRVCDACFLYLSSSGAKNSLRLNSLRLRRASGTFVDENTNTSTAAVDGTEGGEGGLYESDNDEEENYEREEVDEDDLMDFNESMKDKRNLLSFQKQVSIGTTNNVFRVSDEELSPGLPTLLQNVGKTFSGVMSFSNPAARSGASSASGASSGGAGARPGLSSSKSLRFPTSPPADDVGENQRSNSGDASPSSGAFTPPKPPKPSKPLSVPHATLTQSVSAKSEPASAPVPVSTPESRPAAFTRPGLMRSVSAFVTTSTNFLTTGSTTPLASPVTSPQTRTLPTQSGPPVPPPKPLHKPPPPVEMEEMSRSTRSITPPTTTEGQENSPDGEDQSRSMTPPPVKPPKPNRMSRRTNICISADDIEQAKAQALLNENESEDS